MRLRKYTVVLPVRNNWLILLCFLYTVNHRAQTLDTNLYQLHEITILQTKQEAIQPSKKHESVDSLILSRYNTTSLADLLSGQSTVHIKSYGNGNIATTSIRGGNSSHTALIWNGLNIQNPMLGQPDLSLISNFLFDRVSLEYGGGSALWGSGAMGGSIHLQNNTLFNQGIKTKLQMSLGSFDSRKIAAAMELSYQKVVSNTRVYYNTSKNNYMYKDTTDKENQNKQISHADYVIKGVLQEFSFLIKPYQKIGVRLWYNQAMRNLPSYTSVVSKQSQEDENLKINADWNYSRQKLNSTIRLAYFNDILNYTDSMIDLFSKSRVKTLIAENDHIYTIKNHRFNAGINYTAYEAETKDYINARQLNKLAVFATYQLSAFNSKLNYNLSARKEWTNQTYIPVTGNSGIHYQLTKYLAAKINANKSFRQPALNDLYWNPGGNPDLKPEESYEADGGLEFKYQKNKFSFLIEATYFDRHTTNWIIWLPSGNTYWTPKNIAEVYSRGTETRTELAYRKKEWFVKWIINTSYVLSTNQKATSENDNAVGRQLIYTPRYSGQATLLVNYKKVNVLFNQNYTGYRFTSTDNTSWLSPYYLTNIKVACNYAFRSFNMEVFGGINNVFNKSYVVVANRPMPLRNFEIGMTIQYHKIKKHI